MVVGVRVRFRRLQNGEPVGQWLTLTEEDFEIHVEEIPTPVRVLTIDERFQSERDWDRRYKEAQDDARSD